MTETVVGSFHPSIGDLIRWFALTAAVAAVLILVAPAHSERGWPTSAQARHFRFPPDWLKHSGVWCIHRHESVDWHRRWVDWRGAPSRYAGGMEFEQRTWDSAGGRGEPWEWSIREQVYRAYVRWHADGDRWAVEWGSAGACGLR